MMKHIIKIQYNHLIVNRIIQFYVNAKNNKYNHSYGWEEVFNDIRLAHQDVVLVSTDKTTPEWINARYNVARNKRGWAFAYTIEDDVMYIHDAENCRNLTTTSKNTEPFIIVADVSNTDEKQCISMRYNIYACRNEDGYIYLYKNRQQLPNYRFNDIIKPFYKYKNGEIYAIGLYGDKKFKITLDGVAKVLQEMRIRKIVHQVINEALSRKGSLFAS